MPLAQLIFINMIRLTNLLKEAILIDKLPAIPVMQESLSVISELATKTLLTREFRGIQSGAAKIAADPPKKFSIDPVINEVYKHLMQAHGLSHLIYCSHGNARFHLAGSQYYMVPISPYKIIWSPEVADLLVTANFYASAGKLDDFPYDTYQKSWPQGDVSEVIVDCDEYYLITTRMPIVRDWMRKNKVDEPSTYADLYAIIEGTIQPYINK